MKEMQASRRDGRLIQNSRLATVGTLSDDRRRELGLALPPVNLSFAVASGPLDTSHRPRSRSPPRVLPDTALRLDALEDLEFMRQNPSAEAGALKIRLRRYEEEA